MLVGAGRPGARLLRRCRPASTSATCSRSSRSARSSPPSRSAGGSPTSSCRVATFANMYVVLTTLYPDNPQISDWLGIGDAPASEPGVAIVALAAHGARSAGRSSSCGDEARRERAGGRRPTRRREAGAGRELADPADAVADGRPVAARGDAAPARPRAPAGQPRWASAVAGRRPAAPPRRRRMPTPDVGPTGPSRRRSAPLGWLRARLADPPLRADRSRARSHGERGGRLDRLDVWSSPSSSFSLLTVRMWRLDEPYQMHFDEVYHAADRDRVPPGLALRPVARHLRVDPPAPGQVRDGAGHRRCGARTRSAPRASSACRSGRRRRAAARRPPRATDGPATGCGVATGQRGPRLRPRDARARRRARRARRGGARRRRRPSTAVRRRRRRARSRRSTSPRRLGRARRGSTPSRRSAPSTTRSTRLLVTDDGRRSWPPRTTAVTASTRRRRDPRLGRRSTASPTGARPARADRSSADPAAVDDRGRRAATLAELLGGDAADYEAALRPPGPTARSSSAAGQRRRPGPASRPRSTTGAWPGCPIVDLPRIAVATAAGVAFIDPTPRPVVTTIELDGGAHGLAWSSASTTRSCTSRAARPTSPATRSSPSAATAPRTARRQRQPPAARPGDAGRLRRRHASRSTSWAGARARRRGRRPVDRLRRRAARATPSTPTRRCRPSSRRRPGSWTSNRSYPTDGSPAAARVRRRRRDRVDRDRLARVRLAAARRHRRRRSWRVCLYVLARILFRRRTVAGLVGLFVAARRDALRPVPDRHERRLRRRCSSSPRTRSSRRSGRAGGGRRGSRSWLAMPVDRRPARPRARLEVGRGLRHRRAGAAAPRRAARSAGSLADRSGSIAHHHRARLHRHHRPEGEGGRQLTFLLIMVGLTLIAVVVDGPPPDRLDRRGAVVRAVAPGRRRRGRRSSAALAPGRIDTALHARARSRSRRCSLAIALGRRLARRRPARSLVGRPARASGRWRRRPARTTRARVLPPPDRAAARLAAPGLAGRPAGRCWPRSAWSPSRSRSTSCRTSRGRSLDNHQLWAGLSRPATTGQTLLELTGQMYGYHNGLTVAAPRVVAVVGLAARPQAGLVLPGRLRRRRRPRPSTTPATWSSGGWPSRPWSSPRSWPTGGGAWPWPSSPSASPPSGSRGRASTGRPSSTTTTRPCRS